MNVIRASEDFKSSKIDVFFFAVGAPKVQEIAAAVGGLRVLNMEILPDSEKRMKAIRPEYYFSTVNPAPHIAGVDKPTKVQTIDFIIGVGTHVPDAGGGRLHQGGAQQQERRWSRAIRTSAPTTRANRARCSRGSPTTRRPRSTGRKPALR